MVFNHLFTITNLPIGRTKFQLQHRQLLLPYLKFLESHHNGTTVEHLMCRNELSIDYRGNVYDCDFNQQLEMDAAVPFGHVGDFDLDAWQARTVRTARHCYGCTAGSGSSCTGSLA